MSIQANSRYLINILVAIRQRLIKYRISTERNVGVAVCHARVLRSYSGPGTVYCMSSNNLALLTIVRLTMLPSCYAPVLQDVLPALDTFKTN